MAGALIEPTIPELQCVCGASCLQKNQMGFEVFVIVKFQVGNPVVKPIGMKIVPVSNPSPIGSHGSAKVDWVTEWLPGAPENVKVTTSPTDAVMLGGLKMKTVDPVPPTAIW